MSIYIPNSGGPGGVNNFVWDTGLLAWVVMTQAGGGGGGGGDASAANQVIGNGFLQGIENAVETKGSIAFLAGVVANTTGIGVALQGSGTLGFRVDNIGGAGGTTIFWEGSVDFGSNYFPVTARQLTAIVPTFAQSTTATGKTYWTINTSGLDTVRFSVTNYSAGTITVDGYAVGCATDSVYVATAKVIAVSGSVSASGNNTCVTPTSGKKLRISYLAYNPSAAVEAAFRFTTGGALFLRNSLTVAGSVIAKDYGDFRYIEGGVNETLELNLSSGVATIWNANYVEV